MVWSVRSVDGAGPARRRGPRVVTVTSLLQRRVARSPRYPMFQMSLMPRTSLDSMFGWLSKSSRDRDGLRRRAACRRSPTACGSRGRRGLTVFSRGLSIAGVDLRVVDLAPVGVVRRDDVVPANVGSSTVCGSAKSRIQPTVGQTSISCFGTPQYLLYITDWSTSVKFVLKPRLWTALVDDRRVLVGRVAGRADDLDVVAAGVLAARVARQLHVLRGHRQVAGGVLVVVDLRAGVAARLGRSRWIPG